MRVFVMDCGGVLGPPLIRWLLDHTDAAVLGGGRRHERLDGLLQEPRFTFYTLDGHQETQLIASLVENTDVVVDLSPIEAPVVDHRPISEIEEELRMRAETVHLCAANGRRLVHVSSADVYGRRWSSIAIDPSTTDADRQLREDDAPLITAPLGEDEELGIAHERMVQHLIYSYGDSEGFEYTILRVFDVMGEELETLPIRERRSPLVEVRDGLLARDARTISLDPDDLYMRTVVYAPDVAEAIGLAVMDEEGRALGEVINVGDPGNRVAPRDLARLVLGRYRERYWDGSSPLPRIVEVDITVADPDLQLRLPSIEKAVRLIDWRPQWPLRDAIDDSLARLMGPPPVRA